MRIRWNDTDIQEVKAVDFSEGHANNGDEHDWQFWLGIDDGTEYHVAGVIEWCPIDTIEEAREVVKGIIDKLMKDGYIDFSDALEDYGLQIF